MVFNIRFSGRGNSKKGSLLSKFEADGSITITPSIDRDTNFCCECNRKPSTDDVITCHACTLKYHTKCISYIPAVILDELASNPCLWFSCMGCTKKAATEGAGDEQTNEQEVFTPKQVECLKTLFSSI